MKYLKYYISDILPFIAVFTVVYAVIRLIINRKNCKTDYKREALLYIFSVYILALFLKTLVPKELLHFSISSGMFMLPNSDSFYNNPEQSFIYIRAFFIEKLWFRMFDVFILNAVMLIPFGFLFPILFPKYKNDTVLIGIIISIMIEVLQLFTYRLTDTFDIFLNSLSVITGYLLYILYIKIKKRREA